MEHSADIKMERQITSEESFPTGKSTEITECIERYSTLSEPQAIQKLKNFATLPPSEQGKIKKVLPVFFDHISPEKLVEILPQLFAPVDINLKKEQLFIVEVLIKRIGMEGYSETPKERVSICETLIDFLLKSFDVVESKITQRASELFVALALVLPDEIVENKLLKSMLDMFHDVEKDNQQIIALTMIPRMFPRFSKETFEGFIATEIVALCHNERADLRLEAYRAFFGLVDQLDSVFLERKFLEVINMMNDDSHNEVRILFTSHIALIAKKLPFKSFKEIFEPDYSENLESDNTQLRKEAISKLGLLLVAISSISVPTPAIESQSFAKLYLKFFDLPNFLLKLPQVHRSEPCKANCELLAKILYMRPEGAWNRLKKFILGLDELDDDSVEIAKIAMASQLSILASIPDKKTFLSEFLPLLDEQFLTLGDDTTERVKLITLKHLSSVLVRLDKGERDRYADVFCETLGTDITKWRIRYQIALQIEKISALFSEETVTSKIVPLFFALCKDPVAIVRTTSAKMFAKLYASLTGQTAKSLFFDSLRAFSAYSQNFNARKISILMLQSLLISSPGLIDEQEWEILTSLSQDKVVNVQIQVAILLKSIYESSGGKFNSIYELFEEDHSSYKKKLDLIIESLAKSKDSDLDLFLYNLTLDERFKGESKPNSQPLTRGGSLCNSSSFRSSSDSYRLSRFRLSGKNHLVEQKPSQENANLTTEDNNHKENLQFREEKLQKDKSDKLDEKDEDNEEEANSSQNKRGESPRRLGSVHLGTFPISAKKMQLDSLSPSPQDRINKNEPEKKEEKIQSQNHSEMTHIKAEITADWQSLELTNRKNSGIF